MIKKVKSEKAVTMITLVITVIVLVIVTGTLAVNSHDSTQISKFTKLNNDIEALNDRVAIYFVEHEELPIYGNVYKKSEIRSKIDKLSSNDGDDYYIIDLSKLDNLTLNYGSEYVAMSDDAYIINVESHVIYYLKGIMYNGELYHTTGKNPPVMLNS